MSSTDRESKARIAREFFREELAPLAKEPTDWLTPCRRGASPDDTYFVRREKTRWTRADFESQSVASPEALERALRDLWKDDERLARLAPKFAALAREVYDVDDQAGEVTPFMYVMF